MLHMNNMHDSCRHCRCFKTGPRVPPGRAEAWWGKLEVLSCTFGSRQQQSGQGVGWLSKIGPRGSRTWCFGFQLLLELLRKDQLLGRVEGGMHP
jgi:hypothetical protein